MKGEENVMTTGQKDFSRKSMVDLDVRPEVESGSDPFKSIMTAIGNLKEGEGLHLINLFEPVPLYTVMKMKGFNHSTECIGGVWHIYFFKETGAQVPQGEPSQSTGPRTIEIDVRGLEPPEPMVRIIETLPQVGQGTVLLVHHHREPVMLYDKLEHLGYEAATEKVSEGYYKVRITRKG
ncbi:MAG: DUF2249 domain-containing protein [Nitrospirae bacterium]|nr:DUF2249 domain-containing protein [Nitrospirota bacterium]